MKNFLYCLFFVLALFQIPSLEAAGWGKKDEVITMEGTAWNRVYFDLNGLNLTALIPNYSSATMQNNLTALNGNIEGVGGYVIETSLNPGFTPPKSAAQFVELIQNANPDSSVVVVEAKKFGAKFGADLIPGKEAQATWRFLCTKDRLIKMGTDDRDPKRQTLFFESIKIK